MQSLARAGIFSAGLLVSCHRADPWPATAFQEKRIYNACQAYASVSGRLPAALDELVPDFLPDRHSLEDPDHPEAGEIGYYYYGSGGTGAEPAGAVILASKAERHGRRALIRFGGEAGVAFFKPAHF